MALEAFLYDYAAEKLGDNFVREHLDKLSLPSKFLVYPRLVCGKRSDKSGAAYGSLRQLNSLRNDLVHFKSRSFDLGDLHRASGFHDHLNDMLREGVENAMRCVTLVMSELDGFYGGSAFRIAMTSMVEGRSAWGLL
jgi:hypothetical protein